MAKIKWVQVVCPRCKKDLVKLNPENPVLYIKGIQCPCGRNVLAKDLLKQVEEKTFSKEIKQ